MAPGAARPGGLAGRALTRLLAVLGRRAAAAAPAPGAAPAAGREAIARALARRYPRQRPRRWTSRLVTPGEGLLLPAGSPLDAVAAFDAGTHWHYVSLGLSAPCPDAAAAGACDQRARHELTFRLAKARGEAAPPPWPASLVERLARAERGGAPLAPNQTVETGPIDGRPETTLTALLVVEDRGLAPLATRHGGVSFLQLVGVEGAVRARALRDGAADVLTLRLRARDPELVTRVGPRDGARRERYAPPAAGGR